MTTPRRARVLTALALLLLLAASASGPIRRTSAVFDEDMYLSASRDVFERGDFTYLWRLGIAPLPVLAGWALPAAVHPASYRDTIALARVSALVLFGVPLVLVGWRWMAREAGEAAGAAGAALLALSPNIVAHASIATTDACFVAAALVALRQLERYAENRTSVRLTWLAIALGVALASKYGAIGLFAIVAIVLHTSTRPEGDRRGSIVRAWHTGWLTAGLLVAALAIAWALHGFALGALDPRHLGIRLVMPAPIYGLAEQFRHASLGHDGFLFGERRDTGWWLYTPVALLVKSTPAEIAVFAASLCAFVLPRGSSSPGRRIWKTAFLVYGVLAMTSRVNIGVRYVLLLVPLAVMSGTALIAGMRRTRPVLVASMALGALSLQAWSTIGISPHQISYFNALVGGPAEGYRYLADSNVDWGQDLPALHETLARVGAVHPIAAYFGRAPFDAYGVSAVRWPGSVEDRERADWLAISATYLDGLYTQGRDPFAAFRSIEPSARAAYSILLYRLDRPDLRQALMNAAARDPR